MSGFPLPLWSKKRLKCSKCGTTKGVRQLSNSTNKKTANKPLCDRCKLKEITK